MLKFDGVSFNRGSRPILRGISFELQKGAFTALLGENGAGKSTLCRLCNGLLRPSSGTVYVEGRNAADLKVSFLARRVGYLFQNPDRQLCRNTAREEILLGLELALGKDEDPGARCDEMLRLFSLDGGRPPFGLSRGERQQLALASVLARRPSLLILDEPTTGLDYRECMTIMGIIAELHREGTTVLMITHDMEVALDFAEQALVLHGGELAGGGPIRQVLKDEALLRKAGLLPPQIPALALTLGPGFEKVFTVEEMAGTVETRRAPAAPAGEEAEPGEGAP
ncbi:MAG: energy-coupling factor ABC transporter ATP-binding protein [Treponema sp.]|jgi:energy-coupling factor transport system ATP-binding protein|nr:energy-coupling factor ABC transporter ATP-binding protein [Treponema sp.]